jgi:hypothetical protein
MIGSERSAGALARLAQLIMHHRRVVAGAWIAQTVFGVFATAQVSKRRLEQFSIPGFSAYEVSSDRHTAFATFNRRVSRASAHPELEPARCPWAKSERCSIDPTTQKEQKHGKSD